MKSIKIVIIVAILFMIPSYTTYAKWAYSFIVYNKNVYLITEIKIDSEFIGEELGQVTKYSDREGTYSGNFSNTYPKGTKYYKIKDVDVKESIAIKEVDGSFTQTNYESQYAGAKYNIVTILFYMIAFIILLITVVVLLRKRSNKS